MTPTLIERWACVFPPCPDDSGCEKFVTEHSARPTSCYSLPAAISTHQKDVYDQVSGHASFCSGGSRSRCFVFQVILFAVGPAQAHAAAMYWTGNYWRIRRTAISRFGRHSTGRQFDRRTVVFVNRKCRATWNQPGFAH